MVQHPFQEWSCALAMALSDTWLFSQGVWTQANPDISPSPRLGSSLSFDEALGVSVLFGGGSSDNPLPNDTWIWNGTSWTPVETTHSPSPRSRAGMVFHKRLGVTVLFGGVGYPSPDRGSTQLPLPRRVGSARLGGSHGQPLKAEERRVILLDKLARLLSRLRLRTLLELKPAITGVALHALRRSRRPQSHRVPLPCQEEISAETEARVPRNSTEVATHH